MRELYVNKSEITEINGFLQKDIDGENILIFLRVTNSELFNSLVDTPKYNLRIPDLIINRKKKDYTVNRMDMIYYDPIIVGFNPKDQSIIFLNKSRNFIKINIIRKNKIKNLPK